MNAILLVNKKSSRLIYTCEVIFKWIYHIDFQLTTDRSFFQQYQGPKLQYGQSPFTPEAPFIAAAPLLFEQTIQQESPASAGGSDLPAFFPTQHADSVLSYDPFACIFYWLSRYEEYLPFQADQHGRFTAAASLAGQHGMLDQPLVQCWAQEIVRVINSAYPAFSPAPPPFRALPTFDIDIAWAFRHRPWWRLTGSMVKAVLTRKWGALSRQMAVWTGQQADPYDVYDWLDQLHAQFSLTPVYFFLLGDYGRFDKNIHHGHPALQHLIQKTAQKAAVGIHPSYGSNRKPQQLRQECRRLSAITGQEVQKSRQHFLVLRFPETYRALLAAGIRHDYTMGFADQPGFRAGLACSYPWYDLSADRQTTLIIHPFQVMDVTLRHYLNLTPDEALEKCRQLLAMTRQFGGTFTTLWHNSSFAATEGWAGWSQLYEQLLHEMHP
jgi:hypothetical protein